MELERRINERVVEANTVQVLSEDDDANDHGKSRRSKTSLILITLIVIAVAIGVGLGLGLNSSQPAPTSIPSQQSSQPTTAPTIRGSMAPTPMHSTTPTTIQYDNIRFILRDIIRDTTSCTRVVGK